MASISFFLQSQVLFKNPHLASLTSSSPGRHFSPLPPTNTLFFQKKSGSLVIFSSAHVEGPTKRAPDGAKGLVDELRFATMNLHTWDQAKHGKMPPRGPPVAEWETSTEGCLKFLVDSKLVYDALERIVEKAAFPEYMELRNTGLERSERLAKDLEWLKQQGHEIPKPTFCGVGFAEYLEDISERDLPAFICHYYNIYFGQTAGGRMVISKKIAEACDGKELEFYKWDGNLSQILQNVRDKINKIAEGWSKEEKDRCLNETEKPLKFGRDIIGLIKL
ncbi:heme oxygenase 1, chloroplastic-like [Andrographis paniculata]|uniref:heme oxygenase 1, chloroplastic-like n=1 Tax=Andrographis paniculata TaxID=175694 RepID=UPI0021E785D7|nr:heme oxygenase 1, chloroplastic-like [Andrographis paniculata]